MRREGSPILGGFALVLVLLFVLSACQTKRPKNVLPINYSLRIPEDQIAEMVANAQACDKDAAFKLFEHYHYIENERSAAMAWLTKAAELGHTAAQYNLGNIYSGAFEPDSKDLPKARFWLQQAAANGENAAETKLQELAK